MGLAKFATLRGHDTGVTTALYFYVPAGEGQALVPTLITGDAHGWVAWWSLETRRPLGVWRAHEETVVTIKQLGVSATGATDTRFGLLLTHGKDGEMRLWSLMSQTGEGYTYTPLTNRFPLPPPVRGLPQVTRGEGPEPAAVVAPLPEQTHLVPHSISIPVNTLNFCNVDVAGSLLVTPSTVDSEKFDLYRLPSETSPFQRLERLVDPVGILRSSPYGLAFAGEGRLGSLMRLVLVSETLLFLGMESGHVVGVDLRAMRPVFLSQYHVPNPIITMRFEGGKVLTGSAGKGIEMVDCHSMTLQTFQSSKRGVNDLSLRADGVLAMASWDGSTRLCRNQKVEQTFAKRKPLVALTHYEGGRTEAHSTTIKARTVCLSNRCEAPTSLVRRRQRGGAPQAFMAIGYEDGTIELYRET